MPSAFNSAVSSKQLANRASDRDRVEGDEGGFEESFHGMTDAFNDRIIQYLADCLVCSSAELRLSDCELAVYGRKG